MNNYPDDISRFTHEPRSPLYRGPECPECGATPCKNDDGVYYCELCRRQDALQQFKCPDCDGDLAICINTLTTACPDCGESHDIDKKQALERLDQFKKGVA